MRIATWNIHKCIGFDGVFNPERIVSVIGNIKPDIMALQEADGRFGKREGLLSATALLKHNLSIVHIAGNKQSSHGWCGNVILISSAIKVMRHNLIKLPGVEPRGAIIIDAVHKIHGEIRIAACHMGLMRRCRINQANSILRHIGNFPGTVFIVGDTNEWRSEKSPKNSLRDINVIGIQGERHATFPSVYPLLSLDRILSNKRGQYSVVRNEITKIASDHLPLYMDL